MSGMPIFALMSFLYPAFLWALTALAFPVIIHLFNFRRTRRVYFSDIRLLRIVREASQHMQQIRNRLILLSRLLFLFFLILAFAQPILSSGEKATMTGSVVVYVDNSLSMSVPMPDQTRPLDKAAVFTQTIRELYPRGTRFRLITNNFSAASGHFISADELNEQISAVRLSPQTRTFQDVIKRAGNSARTDVFYLSDFQRSTLGSMKVSDSLMNLNFVPLKPAPVSNIYFDSVAWNSPHLISGEVARLTVWLSNNGEEDKDQVNLRLLLEDNLASVINLKIPAGSVVLVSIDVTVPDRPAGLTLILEDYPVSFDNQFYLTLTPAQRKHVVQVYAGEPQPYFESVFGNQSRFSFRSINGAQMDYRELERADLIILDRLEKIEESLIQFIRNKKDIPILIIPSEQPDLKVLSLIAGKEIRISSRAEHQPLELPDFKNPFFAQVFEEKSSQILMPVCKSFITWNSARSDILKFKDDSPFLSAAGNIFLMAGPVYSADGGFASHALFVPVMYRISVGAENPTDRPYHFIGGAGITLLLDSLVENEVVRLKGTQEIVPYQRIADGKIFLELPPETVTAGIYKVRYGQDTLQRIALNQNYRESELETLTEAELGNLAETSKNINVFEAGTVQTFSNEIKARYLGVPLWKYCLALALAFLMAEILLIRFLKKRTERQPEPVNTIGKPDQLI
jgi:hypothetical protein